MTFAAWAALSPLYRPVSTNMADLIQTAKLISCVIIFRVVFRDWLYLETSVSISR